MKVSKYAALAKRSGYCKVILTETKETWLALRNAIYKAAELPEMHGPLQVRAVLDVPEKAWGNVFLKEESVGSTKDIFGINMSEDVAGELQTEELDIQVMYKGELATGLRCEDGEIVFYDATLMAPVSDILKNSDYAQIVIRKDVNGRAVVVVKNGFEPVAAIMPLDLPNKDFLTKLAELDSLCIEQYERNGARKVRFEK